MRCVRLLSGSAKLRKAAFFNIRPEAGLAGFVGTRAGMLLAH